MAGKLFVFSGPSGAGKGTILNELIKKDDFVFSVSMTTRKPRPGEVDGESYYFVSQEKFDETIKNGGFLEYVHKFEKSYGTPKEPILKMLAEGKHVILDIEMEGALNVKKLYPEAVLIFVLPPSLEVLKERLLGRGSETAQQIAVRQKDIQKEIAQIEKYDYYIVNEDISTCVAAVEAIAAGNGEKYKVNDPQGIINRYKED